MFATCSQIWFAAGFRLACWKKGPTLTIICRVFRSMNSRRRLGCLGEFLHSWFHDSRWYQLCQFVWFIIAMSLHQDTPLPMSESEVCTKSWPRRPEGPWLPVFLLSSFLIKAMGLICGMHLLCLKKLLESARQDAHVWVLRWDLKHTEKAENGTGKQWQKMANKSNEALYMQPYATSKQAFEPNPDLVCTHQCLAGLLDVFFL